MNNVTPDQFPAAAGGNPRAQLRHLRTYRAFQRQDQFEKARIDWKTVITKSESRRHVARNLHAKINQKAGGLQPADRMNTPEEQESMVRLARRIGNQERVSPGDGLGLSWNLRRRMLQARYPRRPSAQGPGFPPEVRKRRAEQERLKRLLTMQGASPRRWRQARIIPSYACPGCHNLFHIEYAAKGQCPNCIHGLGKRELVEIAVGAGGTEREPIGSMDCHRR